MDNEENKTAENGAAVPEETSATDIPESIGDKRDASETSGGKKAAAAGAVILVALLAGGIIYSKTAKRTEPQPGPDTPAVQTETAAEETTADAVTEEAVTEEFIIGLSDTVLTDEIKADLENINVRVLNYMDANEKDTSFITEYGFLYNDTIKDNVTVKDLVKQGYVEVGSDTAEYTDILYIRASDLAKYSSDIDENDDKLQIFTAYNSSEGYFISNDFYSDGVMLDKQQYEELVLSYSFTHGLVHTPKRGESEFDNIVSAISFGEEFDVKHLACDNSYACIVIGSLSDTRVVKEFVLVKKEGEWQIAIDKLEQSEDPRREVNMQFPKMELGLLPKYTIADHGALQNGFSKYEPSLVQLGLVKQEQLPASYDCGTDGFAYMEFGDTHLLGWVNAENKLEFYPVANTEEAIAYMLQFDDDPPVYILNFHN